MFIDFVLVGCFLLLGFFGGGFCVVVFFWVGGCTACTLLVCYL